MSTADDTEDAKTTHEALWHNKNWMGQLLQYFNARGMAKSRTVTANIPNSKCSMFFLPTLRTHT